MSELAGQRSEGVRDRPGILSAQMGAALVVVVGLMTIVVGTFLPWLRSGTAERNSFRAAGLIDRLLHPPGAAGAFLAIWPGVVFACAIAIAGVVLGIRRVAAMLSGLLAVVVGGVATTTLLLPGRPYASVVGVGPAVCLAGAVLVMGGVLTQVAWLTLGRRTRRAG